MAAGPEFGILIRVVVGIVTTGIGCILTVPGVFGLAIGEHAATAFLGTAALCMLLGVTVLFLTRNIVVEATHRTTFAVVVFSWIVACFIGALPYYLAAVFPSFIDCLFESTSGFTTTGSSVLTDIEATQSSVLLWRAMTQFLGGAGIVVFFIALLPILGVGGSQLIRTEMPSPHRGVAPRIREAAVRVFLLYVGLNALQTVSLWIAGMPFFDAVTTAMCTLSTAGFSVRNTGIAAYESATIDYIVIVFMFLGATNFSLLYNLLVCGNWKVLNDTELKGFLGIFAAAIAILTLLNWGTVYSTFGDSLHYSLFSIATIGTTTGFTHQDYLQYPMLSQFILVLLMVTGGMSGSTAGGIKCVRIVAAFKMLANELKKAVHPHAVLTVKMNGKSIAEDVAHRIWALIFMHLLVTTVIVAVLTFEGVDLVTASTAAFEVLSTVGPGLGKIGPMDNFAWMGDASKVALSIGMLFGRLEFISLFVLLAPSYWRN